MTFSVHQLMHDLGVIIVLLKLNLQHLLSCMVCVAEMSLHVGLGSDVNNCRESSLKCSGHCASKNTTACDDLCATEANGNLVTEELKFEEVPLSTASLQKIRDIQQVLSQKPVDADKLREFARSDGGLVTDDTRKLVWPRLLGLDTSYPMQFPTQEQLEAHPEYQQVVLDVNRSLKRFPPGIPYDQRVALQEQLTTLILRVISKYPHLRYYQVLCLLASSREAHTFMYMYSCHCRLLTAQLHQPTPVGHQSQPSTSASRVVQQTPSLPTSQARRLAIGEMSMSSGRYLDVPVPQYGWPYKVCVCAWLREPLSYSRFCKKDFKDAEGLGCHYQSGKGLKTSSGVESLEDVLKVMVVICEEGGSSITPVHELVEQAAEYPLTRWGLCACLYGWPVAGPSTCQVSLVWSSFLSRERRYLLGETGSSVFYLCVGCITPVSLGAALDCLADFYHTEGGGGGGVGVTSDIKVKTVWTAMFVGAPYLGRRHHPRWGSNPTWSDVMTREDEIRAVLNIEVLRTDEGEVRGGCKDGGKWRSPRKPANQQHLLTRSPHAKVWERPRSTGNRSRFI
ncbi:hypothetical protein PR048_031158 [Dryococelus australis]|uniref:Rab-GAP TBC domain-containing protein n=1 Tax=Dryococelus australis TaxID=614101 RepID=A0ABQ9G7D5_9NEOP|nr:hypothetical protein PR048_031158 [Dryococelus australis]